MDLSSTMKADDSSLDPETQSKLQSYLALSAQQPQSAPVQPQNLTGLAPTDTDAPGYQTPSYSTLGRDHPADLGPNDLRGDLLMHTKPVQPPSPIRPSVYNPRVESSSPMTSDKPDQTLGDYIKENQQSKESPAGPDVTVNPAQPQAQQDDYLGSLGKYLRGLTTSGDMGPVGMEHVDKKAIGATVGKEQNAIQVGAKADQDTNTALQPALQDSADYNKDVRMQGESELQEAQNYQRHFMDRAAAATQKAQSMDISPDHYWADKSTAQKIVSGIGAVLGGLGGGPNQGVNAINTLIQRDTEAQLGNRENQYKAAESYKSLAGIAHQSFEDAGHKMAWLNNQKAQETAAMIKSIASKYANPKIQADADLAAAKVSEWGISQMNEAVKTNNSANLMATEARKNNAEAARERLMLGMEPLKFGMEQKKLDMLSQQGQVIDPETGNPLVNPRTGQPIVQEPARAAQVNDRFAGYSTARNGLNDLRGKANGVGWLEFDHNAGYKAGLAAALSGLPADERKDILENMPGPNDVASPDQALAVAEKMIQQRTFQLKQQIGGGPAVQALGGVKH